MLPFVRDFIHYFAVTLPLLLFGLIVLSDSMIVSEILSPDNIQAAFLRYWVPGVVGLLLPPVLIWYFLRLREKTRF
jgi:hypothetical protein